MNCTKSTQFARKFTCLRSKIETFFWGGGTARQTDNHHHHHHRRRRRRRRRRRHKLSSSISQNIGIKCTGCMVQAMHY